MTLESFHKAIDVFFYAIYGRAAETDYERLSMLCALLLAIGILAVIGHLINLSVNQFADWYLTGAGKPKRKSKEDQAAYVNPALLEQEDGDILYMDLPDEEMRLK